MPHIHEKIDFTAEVFIVYGNKVLLRKHDKYKIWLSVGGHIELDEDPNQAAVREVREEVGLEVVLAGSVPVFKNEDNAYRELLPPRFLNRHWVSDTHEHVTLVYFATSKTDTLAQGDYEKSEECRWFSREELEDARWGIRESIRRYGEAALDECGAHVDK